MKNKLVSQDLDRRDLAMRSKDLAFRSKERMKKQWSYLLMIYLITFTIAMFITLWFSGKCVLGFEKFCIVDLNPTTLNFLISVGFGKVIAVVVWIIVKHLFPNENPNKK